MNAHYAEILNTIRASKATGKALRQEAMHLLDTLDGFDWSGIYRLEGNRLKLDAYVGAPTDHIDIPVGVGVCGSAVAEDRNKVIADVREEDNYLSCSVSTKSEIVVLIRRGGKVIAQIDIDGHTVGRFGKPEEEFLSELADLLALRWDEA